MKDRPRTNPSSRHIGRPAKPMPIPDNPENVTRAIMKTPPKKNWRYLKDAKAKISD